MLVLTRRADQKIVFPSVGITIDVLRIKGNVVKIGVQAPSDIQVLRHEIAGDVATAPESRRRKGDRLPADQRSREQRHAMRNRLNAATIALHLLRRQLAAGFLKDAEATLDRVVREFHALEQAATGSAVADGEPEATAGEASLRRALLVEDDQNECELLAGYLRMSGFEVSTAGDGVDALDYLSSHDRPDVVLLDMLMPRCNGAKTIELIRRNPEYDGLKVFAISGTAPDELGVVTGPCGIDRWFSKPVNPEALVQEMSCELTPGQGA